MNISKKPQNQSIESLEFFYFLHKLFLSLKGRYGKSTNPLIFDFLKVLELLPSETKIAKAGILDGARIAWADKKNVLESSISDQTALQGIIFLNEDCTIERVN